MWTRQVAWFSRLTSSYATDFTISPLHTIRHCLQTMTKLLFHKKIKFRETCRKEVYTLFVIHPSFHEPSCHITKSRASEGWYTRARRTCFVLLTHKLQTYFLKMGLRTCALLQLYAANQILSVFARKQREYCEQFERVFTFKFVFANCKPDYSIKSYVQTMFSSTIVCRMFAEN